VIAGHIAALIDDGCTLQMGVGKVPTALAERLRDRRRLRIHSGLVSDGFANLMESGALDADFVHTACVASGTGGFYRWLPEARGLRIAGCEITHGALTLAALQRFVAVNSALEVDLFGQCNLEHAQGRAVSGAGGAPDFARAARMCAGGLSIVALNASYRKGMASRIVPALSAGAVVSLSRVDVDLVVTEFGVADLRHASVHERALALIGIAAPDFRDDLERAWSKLAATL
jgi:4-hydroxybutyrate CoA-transferase